VEAVDQGGHDGLNEEPVLAKGIAGEASRDKAFVAIDPVILGEAILSLPSEVRNPAALILNAAAKEPTLGRAARKEGVVEAKAGNWREEVTSAGQMSFSVAAGEVGEEVRAHEPADAATDSPLRVHLLLRGKEGVKGIGASTPHVGPIVISQDADHELTR